MYCLDNYEPQDIIYRFADSSCNYRKHMDLESKHELIQPAARATSIRIKQHTLQPLVRWTNSERILTLFTQTAHLHRHRLLPLNHRHPLQAAHLARPRPHNHLLGLQEASLKPPSNRRGGGKHHDARGRVGGGAGGGG